jgi:hypothetical protein
VDGTLKEDRALSPHEIEILAWMLAHASPSLEHLTNTARTLRVVGRCGCGCPSVDFELNGQALPNQPLVDATGRTADGIEVGVILWGRPDAVTGLEFYEMDRPVTSLPLLTTLRLSSE